MADVAKVVTIIGSSPESFAKAADAAVQEAAKTIRGITGADVVSMSAEVEGDHITTYRTTVNIAFAVELILLTFDSLQPPVKLLRKRRIRTKREVCLCFTRT